MPTADGDLKNLYHKACFQNDVLLWLFSHLYPTYTVKNLSWRPWKHTNWVWNSNLHIIKLLNDAGNKTSSKFLMGCELCNASGSCYPVNLWLIKCASDRNLSRTKLSSISSLLNPSQPIPPLSCKKWVWNSIMDIECPSSWYIWKPSTLKLKSEGSLESPRRSLSEVPGIASVIVMVSWIWSISPHVATCTLSAPMQQSSIRCSKILKVVHLF